MEKTLKAILGFSLAMMLLITGGISAFAESDAEIVLEFPHWFFSHGDAFAEWIVPAIAAYEEMHPNIKVNGYAVAYDEYWDKLDTSIASNSAPDVMALSNTNLSKYIDAGVILPFDDYIDMQDTLDNTAASLLANVINLAPDGKTYLLLSDIGYYLPMYRPSVFEEAGIESYPTTPEEFYDAMGKLADAGIIPYACMTTPGNYVEGAIDLSIWIIGMGGHYGVDGLPTLNSEYVKETFKNIKKLYDAGYIVKDTDKGTYRKMFATGNVGTIIDGQFMYTMLLGWDPTVEGDYVVADLPFPTQHAAAFYEGLAVSATSEHPQEAADLIAYLCGFEQQQRILDITGIGSARTDVLADEAFAAAIYEKWPWMEAYADHLEGTVLNNPDGITGNDLPEIQKILYTALEQVLFENADIDTVLEMAQEEAMALFE